MVGTDPLLTVGAFLAVLVLWLVYSLYGVATSPGAALSPGAMALLTSLAPVHSLLVDLGAVLTPGGSPWLTVLFLSGLLLLRAAILAFLLAAILDRIGPPSVGPETGPGPEGPAARAGRIGRRALGTFPNVLAIEAGFYVFSMLTALLALGFALGQLAVIGGLIGGLYFFVFAPIAVLAEGANPRQAVQLSIKAARLPGPRHMVATAAYTALALLVSLFAPASRVYEATPAVTTWMFTLLATFLHVSALAMFAYRWLVVRDRVLGGPASTGQGRVDRQKAASPLR